MPVTYTKFGACGSMSAIQLSEYRDTRMSLLIAVTGSDGIVISTSLADIALPTPLGIHIPASGDKLLTHVLHGEIIWYPWYANCTTSIITVWEWFCTPNIPGPSVTPVKTLCETTSFNPVSPCFKPKNKCTKIQEEQKKKLIDILNKYKAGPNGLVVNPPTLPPLNFNENPIINPNPLDPSSQSPSGYYNASGAWVIGVKGEY